MINPMEIVIAVFLIFGAAIHLLSALGLVRFGDVFLRMHASTKASTLGVGFIMIATALYFADALITIKLLALLVIYFFTSPTGVQVLAHAAHISELPMVKETWIDELAVHQSEKSSPDAQSQD